MHKTNTLALVLLTAGVTACGGGGGGAGGGLSGGSSGSSGSSSSAVSRLDGANASLVLDVVSQNFTGDRQNQNLQAQSGGSVTLILNTDSSGKPSSVNLIASGLPGLPSGYGQTFSNFSSVPLAGLTGNSLKTTIVDTAAQKAHVFEMTDPISTGFAYTTLGHWQYFDNAANTNVGGWFVAGKQSAQTLPSTGTASYSGIAGGTYSAGGETFAVNAAANANVDFGNRSVVFATTGSQSAKVVNNQLQNFAGDNSLNLSGSLQIQSGTNGFAGTLTSAGSGSAASQMSGSASGKFFGNASPAKASGPAEMGGTFFLKNGANDRQMVGGFILK